MERAPEKIALIDMDGSIVDYDLAMKQALASIAAPGEPEDYGGEEPPWLSARMALIKSQTGFWANLPRIEEGFAVLAILKEIGFTLNILTKGPFKTTSAWSEKVAWCRNHLGDVPVTITEDKSIVYGRVLFDDWPPYMLGWIQRRPRGIGVMMETSWNKDFTHERVLKVRREHIHEDLTSIRHLLWLAYDR